MVVFLPEPATHSLDVRLVGVHDFDWDVIQLELTDQLVLVLSTGDSYVRDVNSYVPNWQIEGKENTKDRKT